MGRLNQFRRVEGKSIGCYIHFTIQTLITKRGDNVWSTNNPKSYERDDNRYPLFTRYTTHQYIYIVGLVILVNFETTVVSIEKTIYILFVKSTHIVSLK